MSADFDDGGRRFRLKPSSDSDPRRTGIPIDPGQGRHRRGYGIRRRLRRQAWAPFNTYNNLNQLAIRTGQQRRYDANGNLLSDGQRTYAWDAENRLVGITYPGQPGKATAFTYDGLGRRTAISSTPAGGGSPVTTSYVWRGSRICEARDASGAVTREYYAEGELVPGTPAQLYYYGPDQIGSVRRVFASTSTAPAFSYDPYGNALQATAPLTDYGYAGMFYDAESGLYLTTHRAYDPTTGRWLSRDPIGEGGDPTANLYAYVGGNPVSLSDPEGLCFLGDQNLKLLATVLAIEVAGGGPEDPIADAGAIEAIIAAQEGGAAATDAVAEMTTVAVEDTVEGGRGCGGRRVSRCCSRRRHNNRRGSNTRGANSLRYRLTGILR